MPDTTTVQEYEEMVSHPGKFEGEARYVPYFYDIMMDGGGEVVEDNGHDGWVDQVMRFEVDPEDVQLFPELSVGSIYLHFDNQGFVTEIDYDEE